MRRLLHRQKLLHEDVEMDGCIKGLENLSQQRMYLGIPRTQMMLGL